MSIPHTLMSEAIECAMSDAPLGERRIQFGNALQRIFKADVFVSFTRDASGPYADPVEVNLGEDMLAMYELHYRHVDELTPRLSGHFGAAAVVTERETRDEFVGDFLHRCNMYSGMNYHSVQPRMGAVDLRLWRGRGAAPFSSDDVRLLQQFGELIDRLWPAEQEAILNLTPRERQVAEHVAEGWSDRQICDRLGMALPTLRTHLSRGFEKTGARSRAGLASAFLRAHGR